MINIYLGSNNPVKLSAVKEVFREYTTISYKSDSTVSAQPKTIEETIKGAEARAKNISAEGIRIGLEAGVQIINNQCYLINFGCLIDEFNNKYYAGGTFIPLPEAIRDKIFIENKELKDCIEEIFGEVDINLKNGTIGYLTCDFVKRKDIFVHICKLLKGQMQRRNSK